ncbi:hypothetical protein [Candidatus Coxiella mudrowiae]|uniref:hypothetical protein n=1 Tax=Candidatus Coxiella mudrowiae TaxID=2054173 RepID=UPI001FCFC726|nr:hypothetical protein [Candidatus Coxiella mudrowiae]
MLIFPIIRNYRKIFSCLVLLRLGTLSPWSSKASEIARNCELPITRIEWGFSIAFREFRERINKILKGWR